MANVLFVTHERKRKEFLSHLLGPECLIITCDGEQEIDSLVPLVDLIIVDFSSLGWEGLNVVSTVKRCHSSGVVLGIGRGVEKEIIQSAKERGLAEYIDVDEDIISLSKVVREKAEKNMLASEIKEKELSRSYNMFLPEEKREKSRISSLEEWKFLEEMSRFLTHGYNLNELLYFFLDLLSKMFGLTRLCILLKEEGKDIYRIRACLGLSKEIKEHIQLYPQRGLVRFLAREGTVVTRDHLPQIDFKMAYQIKQDMKLINSHVVIPISFQGRLIGILGFGPKITGEELVPKEIKQVFLFCNQVGLAIQNLLFYEKMGYQKKYIEDVLKNASSGVISIDTEQRITTCNPRAKKMLNLEEEKSLIGKDMRKLCSPLGDFLFETLTKGASYERKEVYVPALKRWLGISTSQMRDAQGKVIGSMMIFTDLTPIKRLKEEKKKLQKRDFLAQVSVRLSHELRNSFVPIKSLVELLPSKYMDEEFQKKLFSVVTKEIERIDNLIERLLFFSQPLHLDKVAGSVPNLLNEAVEEVKNKLPKDKEIQLSIECKEDNLQVYTDKKALIEAISYIIANSIEAVGDGPVKIEVKCETTDKLPEIVSTKTRKKAALPEATEYVRIEIKDNGPGLPEENTDSIFDPFFTTKNRGIGLGLTISQTIIEAHGGSIIPVSKKGEGATMVVYLPRYKPPF